MSNFFEEIGGKINKSVYVIPIFIVFVALFVVGLGLSAESYFTSLAGYETLPTLKVHDWVFPLVALLPQIGFIAFFYVWLTDTSKRWALWLVLLFHFADMYTDVAYKTGNWSKPFGVWIIAIFESELLFTIGAHILTTLASGMVFELLPDFVLQWGVVTHKVSEAFGIAGERLVESGTGGKKRKSVQPLAERD